MNCDIDTLNNFFKIVFLYSIRSPEIEWDNYISNAGPQFLLSTKLYTIIERICNWLMELYAFQLGNGDQVQGFCRSSAYQCKYAHEIFIEAEFLSEVRRRKTEEETRIS